MTENGIWGTLTLGELIRALAAMSPDRGVHFDFGGLSPKGIHSYRGFYDHLAIGYAEIDSLRVGELLEDLRAAVGRVFEGYKGVSYRMTEQTPVWVSQVDRASSTTITEIRETNYGAVIMTGFSDV